MGWKETQQVIERLELDTNKIQLQSQRDELKELDSKILDVLLKDASEDACDKEVDETYEYKEKSTRALLYLEKEITERDLEDEVVLNKSVGNSEQFSQGNEGKAASNRPTSPQQTIRRSD